MTTARDCTDNYLEYYDRTTSLPDRQRVYCEAKLAASETDRRTASNVAYLRLFAANVELLPRFHIVYTPFLAGEHVRASSALLLTYNRPRNMLHGWLLR